MGLSWHYKSLLISPLATLKLTLSLVTATIKYENAQLKADKFVHNIHYIASCYPAAYG